MNVVAEIESASTDQPEGLKVRLPLGLLGFEQTKEYSLIADPAIEPFLWLQAADDPNLAFLVLSPFEVVPDYQPDLSREDLEFLGLEGPDESQVLSIVTLRRSGGATVNLKGPVVLNRRTRSGKQVIPSNAASFSVQHPLPVVA